MTNEFHTNSDRKHRSARPTAESSLLGSTTARLSCTHLGSMGLRKATLLRQKQRENAHACACQFDLLVVFTNPGAHDLVVTPGGNISDKQPCCFALTLQFDAAAGQKLSGDVTHRTPIDKAQGHLVSNGGIDWTSLLTRPGLFHQDRPFAMFVRRSERVAPGPAKHRLWAARSDSSRPHPESQWPRGRPAFPAKPTPAVGREPFFGLNGNLHWSKRASISAK